MSINAAQISQDTIVALRGLIGRQIHRIYSPVLDVAGPHIAAPSFSIPLSDQIADRWMHRFLNVKAVWSETARFMNDYWEIQAHEDKGPLGIDVTLEGAMVSPCSISFYKNGGSAITSIQVHTIYLSDSEDDNESVIYDKVLLLRELMEARSALRVSSMGSVLLTTSGSQKIQTRWPPFWKAAESD